MPIEVRLPQLADAMTAAKVGAWLKREGDRVASGEPIVEVETDKTNVEIEAPVSGVLQKILIATGSDGVLVGALLATIVEAHESAPAPSRAEPAGETPGAPRTVEPERVAPSVRSLASDRAASLALTESVPADGLTVTPVARKMAKLAGVDLAPIRPADGVRITKSDVERALGKRPVASVATPATTGASALEAVTAIASHATSAAFEDRPLSNMRRVTAVRLLQAKQTVPHFYLQAECRVDALMDLRAGWNARGTDPKVTVTDLLVFAVSRALRKVPLANSAWAETAVRVFERVDIAVAVNTPKGLITPIVRGAERKSIAAIARELSSLAERARSGGLNPDDYTGGTFTISNLGMFGVTSITPIVNTPQACILGVGAVEQRPVITGNQVVVGRTMSCTLAADHRAIDGATGAEFMAELRRRLEDPQSMTLEV